MKKILCIVILLISCSKETELPNKQINLSYDPTDNVIKFENSQWLQSWNFKDNQPAQKIGIKHHSDTIHIQSNNYQIQQVKPVNFKEFTIIFSSQKTVKIKYPNLYKHLDNGLTLNFKITVQ